MDGFPVNVTYINTILDTLGMLLLIFWCTLNEINLPKNLGTSKTSYFLPKLLENYGNTTT